MSGVVKRYNISVPFTKAAQMMRSNDGTQACFADACEWVKASEFDKLAAEKRELEEQLGAWHSIFGTTQLSHAQERLRVAESAESKLQEVRGELERYTRKAESGKSLGDLYDENDSMREEISRLRGELEEMRINLSKQEDIEKAAAQRAETDAYERAAKEAEDEPCMQGQPSESVIKLMNEAGVVSVARTTCTITRRGIAERIRALASRLEGEKK